jgi:hypothetical protein
MALQLELGGEIEVDNKAGRADLVTYTHVIEVKIFYNWKHALGQIIAYGREFPDLKMAICLFGGHISEYNKDTCRTNNIEIMYRDVPRCTN